MYQRGTKHCQTYPRRKVSVDIKDIIKYEFSDFRTSELLADVKTFD